MVESMHAYMKVGILHFMIFPEVSKGDGPIVETMRKIVLDDFFDAVEITTINDPAVLQQVARMTGDGHMDVAFGAQPRLLGGGFNVNDLDEAKRTAAVDNLKEGIDQAYALGAKAFGYLSGRYEEATKEQAFAQLVRSTGELCAYARGKGDMKIALEVFDYDIDKKVLIGPAPITKRFAEAVCPANSNFGLLVDLSHIPIIHETVEESVLPVKDYIIHAHMGNAVIKDPGCAAYGDMHPRFGFPNGENDVAELAHYLRVLLDIGFLNKENPPFVSFEIKPWGDEDSEIVIANAKRTLNRAWALV